MKKEILLLPIRTIFFIICFYIISLICHSNVNETCKWWTLVVNIVNLLTIGILLVYARLSNINIKEFFKSKNKIRFRETIFVALIISIFALLGMNITALVIYHKIPYTPECMFKQIPLWLAIVNILVLPITTTIAEEGLYLGIGMNNIKNKCWSIVIPLFFYMLQHSFFPFILDLQFIVFRFFSFLLMLLFICVYYKQTNKIKPIMVGHFITNFVTVIQLLILSV